MPTSFRRSVPLLALLGALLFPLLAAAQTPPTRIMPLGDSITYGASVAGGYRNKLYQTLTAAGYSVDFVGTQTANGVGTLPDSDHEGHSGWNIGQLDANIPGWFGAIADPDVILLHIGTNDFGQNLDTPNAINRLDALITKMATLRPYAHIIVTNLMERNEPQNTTIQAQFNPYVQARVNAQAALGRRVTFLDMRSAVPLAEMPDQLHPGQAGYDHMADAWLPAIQAVIGTQGDGAPPAIVRAVGNVDRTHVAITFSKPVANSAATVGNFALSGGLTVAAAVLDASKRTVTLTTSLQTLAASYTATVNGVVDRTAGALALPANSTVNFNGATPRGYLSNVPESAGYTLAYSLDLPTVANYGAGAVPYAVDNRNGIGPFTRVAYYLELQTAGGDLQYVWASVDAFTTDAGKIGVPTVASGAVFQQGVIGMNVVSNVPGISVGTGLAGNLEFWPTNYAAANSAGVAGASDTLYDFGDQPAAGNYGSMQLHNTGAGQTVFGLNNWGGTVTAVNLDLGIGSNPAPVNNGVDWTFANNAGNYTVKTLQVLVQTSGDTMPPTLASATATFGRTLVTVRFSEPLAGASVKAENFSLNGGVTVLGATLAANQRDVQLLTTAQPAGTPLTLTVSGVRDSSPNANRIIPGSSIAVSAAALPPEIVANVGAAASGYQLVASIDFPVTGNFNASNSAYTFDERAAAGAFSRVAYYLELQTPGGPVQYVWAAMDAFTINKAKLGIPTAATGAVFQQNVTNLSVLSNVAGVVNGTTATGGNIEFWPGNYAQANALGVPNASATTFDFGDTLVAGAGYGCMQIHNHAAAAAQTVLAVNDFGIDGSTLDIGIGNDAAPVNTGVDWTFAANAGTYSRRVLHVLVLPAATPVLPAAVAANVPEAAGYQLVYSLAIPASGNVNSLVYGVDNHTDIGSFTRVAYYLELQTGAATPKFVWTAMDAFTTDAGKVGVPTAPSGASFQQNVANLNVVSNVAGIVTGTGLNGGNIEFWPGDYTPGNGGNVPNASGTTYDFGDTRVAGTGYGSMQIHNHASAAQQTLFAFNHWGATSGSNGFGLGLGSQPSGSPDWTFSDNSAVYSSRVLHVLVLPGISDTTGPVPVAATGSSTLNRLTVTFNESVADISAMVGNFSIPGLTVTGATLLSGQKEIALTTSAQTPGAAYSVAISGVRDRSQAANPVLPGAAISFTAVAPQPVLANVPETAGYRLIHKLAIPTVTPQWNVNPVAYSIDESRYGEQLFDRVAYLLELDGQWVYASFDRHTGQLAKVGVPTLGVTATALQQNVAHMNVASNVAGIVTGTDLAGGNIEFWGGDYSAANALGIPGASDTLYDWGDTMTAGGHGCMQVHNHAAGQTLFGLSNWGSTPSQTTALGIGNNPNAGTAGQGGTQAPDWTFCGNATSFTTRNLYVLVRPGGTATGPAPVLLSQPVSRVVNPGGSATLAVAVSGAGTFTYQWRFNGAAIAGAVNPWLDLSAVGFGQTGAYDVIVTGANLVATTSLAAVLTVNHAPTFGGFTFTTQKNTPVLLTRAGLVAKGADPDGHALTLTAASPASAQGGTASLAVAGATYTPAPGFLGADRFTVTIADGFGGSVIGTVNATVTTAPFSAAGQSSLAIRPDGKVDLLFYGTPAQSYAIQRSIDLANPLGWITLLTLGAGDDGIIPCTDPTPPVGAAFYRTFTTLP